MNREHRHSLRREILARRDTVSTLERREKSRIISALLLGQPEIQTAGMLFVYMHFRSEVRTREIIRWMLSAGKTVAIPFTRSDISRLEAVRITDPENEVVPGYCGIPEPQPHLVETQSCDPMKIDVVLVPGSVFDRCGGRLGYGGGYYDRFLSKDAAGAVRIGLAYELQLVERVPVEPHDQLMDFIVTEKNVYDCRRNRYA